MVEFELAPPVPPLYVRQNITQSQNQLDSAILSR
jgi:hypothetical protein